MNSAAVDPGRKMDDFLQRAAAETRRLQNCISDLVGVPRTSGRLGGLRAETNRQNSY